MRSATRPSSPARSTGPCGSTPAVRRRKSWPPSRTTSPTSGWPGTSRRPAATAWPRCWPSSATPRAPRPEVEAAPESLLRSPLREGSFRILLGYRLFAILSYQIVAVTVGWHVYELTCDTFALGLVGLAEVLPYIGMALFAGYLVDHLPKRRLGALATAG